MQRVTKQFANYKNLDIWNFHIQNLSIELIILVFYFRVLIVWRLKGFSIW